MTNEEPSTIQPLFLETLLSFGCDYYTTEIGSLYSEYKELTQGQLQKAILKCSNERNKLLRVSKTSRHELTKSNQHLFKLSVWNEELKQYQTPTEVLALPIKFSDPDWLVKKNEFWKNQSTIFSSWYKISGIHLEEIELFYNERKAQLEQEQRLYHINHANEHVTCCYCNANVVRTNLARHYKTNKCLSKRTNEEA